MLSFKPNSEDIFKWPKCKFIQKYTIFLLTGHMIRLLACACAKHQIAPIKCALHNKAYCNISDTHYGRVSINASLTFDRRKTA